MTPPRPTIAQLRPALGLAWAVGVARHRERKPIPGPMRPLVRMAKLPDRMLSTIREAVDSDDDFRTHVADKADEADVGRLSWLWLSRPEGWDEEIAGLLQDKDQQKQQRTLEKDLAQAHRRIASLERDLAKAEQGNAALTKAKDDAVAALEGERRGRRRAESRDEKLAGEIEAARSELASQGAAMDGLRARVAEAEHDLEAARRDAQGAVAERDASRVEARAAAERAEELQRQMEDTRERYEGAEVSEALELARQLRSELERVAAAQGLVVESPPAPEAPAGPGRAAPRRASPGRRVPVALPPGLRDDTVEAADHLVRSRGVTLVVDGYNVSISTWPGRDLADQRWRLTHALAELVTRTGATVRLYFDGVDEGGRLKPPAVARRRMSVEFSPSHIEADDKIIGFVDELSASRPVVVATNDRRVRDAVAARGANVLSVEQLVAVLRRFADAGRG